jgi:hypothetical protein
MNAMLPEDKGTLLMRSIQTSHVFPLSSVKPLEGLLEYRAHCLSLTKELLQKGAQRRETSPLGEKLEPYGSVEGIAYLRSPEGGGIFLAEVLTDPAWGRLLRDVSGYRRSPQAFHTGLSQLRSDNVYLPKLEWINSTLRLHGLQHPRLLEIATPPSDFTDLLLESGVFAHVLTIDEMQLTEGNPLPSGFDKDTKAEVAVLLETLDRVPDPLGLLMDLSRHLVPGSLVFVTSQVSSGFDISVLGLRDLYLYPPDRTNCFSLAELQRLITRAGFALVEISTPGVLDVEVVRAHLKHDPSLPLSRFERHILSSDDEVRQSFQRFLQENRSSSFARIVGRLEK